MELLCIDAFCFKCAGYIWKHSWWSNDETAYWEFQISFICLETIIYTISQIRILMLLRSTSLFWYFLNIPGLLTWKKAFQFMKNIVYQMLFPQLTKKHSSSNPQANMKETFQASYFRHNFVFSKMLHNIWFLCINLRSMNSIYFICVVDISSNNIDQTNVGGVSSIAINFKLTSLKSFWSSIMSAHPLYFILFYLFKNL
jgi:hypothetical protein